jgi:hypothetical protein
MFALFAMYTNALLELDRARSPPMQCFCASRLCVLLLLLPTMLGLLSASNASVMFAIFAMYTNVLLELDRARSPPIQCFCASRLCVLLLLLPTMLDLPSASNASVMFAIFAMYKDVLLELDRARSPPMQCFCASRLCVLFLLLPTMLGLLSASNASVMFALFALCGRDSCSTGTVSSVWQHCSAALFLSFDWSCVLLYLDIGT